MSIITVLNAATVVTHTPFTPDDDRGKMIPVSHSMLGDKSSIPDTGIDDLFWLNFKEQTDFWLHCRCIFDVHTAPAELFFYSGDGVTLEGGFRFLEGTSGIVEARAYDSNADTFATVTSFNSGVYDFDVHFTPTETIVFINGLEAGVVTRNMLGAGVDSLRLTRYPGAHLGEVILSTTSTLGMRLGTTTPVAGGTHNDMGGLTSDINGAGISSGAMVATGPGKQTFNYGYPDERLAGELTPMAVIMASVVTVTDESTAPITKHIVGDGSSDLALGLGHLPTLDGKKSLLDITEVNPLTGMAWTNNEVRHLEFGLDVSAPKALFSFNVLTDGIGYDVSDATTAVLNNHASIAWKNISVAADGSFSLSADPITEIGTAAALKVVLRAETEFRLELTVSLDTDKYIAGPNAALAEFYQEVLSKGATKTTVWFEVI